MKKVQLRCYSEPPVGIELSGEILAVDDSGARVGKRADVSRMRPTLKAELLLEPGTYDFSFSITTWSQQETLVVFAIDVSATPEVLLRKKTMSIDEPGERVGRIFTFKVLP